jgi:hypothetical protein
MQPCNVINGLRMECRMPFVELPWDLENSTEVITYTNSTPGVGAYISSSGSERADIYVGFILDGYKKYHNISEPLPDIKVEFYQQPTISCSTSITFNPNNNKKIVIEVVFRVTVL